MINFKDLSLGQIYVVVRARDRKGSWILLIVMFGFFVVANSSVNLTTCTKGFVELSDFMLLKTIL